MGNCLRWAVFIHNHRSSSNWRATFSTEKVIMYLFWQKWLGCILGDFSQTHPVTLDVSNSSTLSATGSQRPLARDRRQGQAVRRKLKCFFFFWNVENAREVEIRETAVHTKQVCQIFLGATNQSGEKDTKWSQNICIEWPLNRSIGHKIHQHLPL
jgi:hypothetical protein